MDGEPEPKRARLDEGAPEPAPEPASASEPASPPAAADDGAAAAAAAEGEGAPFVFEIDEEDQALLDQALLDQAEEAQAALNKLNDAASEEVLQVEQRYNLRRQPVYQQRGDVLAQVPLFWRRVFMGHPQLQEFLTDDDWGALTPLKRVDVVDAADIKSGFTITFLFDHATNPFFANEVLEKTLHFDDDAFLDARASTIEWRDGMGPPSAEAVEAAAARGDKAIGADYNFFTSWFLSERYGPGTQDAVAEYIKDDIWPDPFRYWRAGLAAEQLAIQMDEGAALGADGSELEEGEEEEGEEYDEGEEGVPGGYDDGGYGAGELEEDEGEDADDQGS